MGQCCQSWRKCCQFCWMCNLFTAKVLPNRYGTVTKSGWTVASSMKMCSQVNAVVLSILSKCCQFDTAVLPNLMVMLPVRYNSVANSGSSATPVIEFGSICVRIGNTVTFNLQLCCIKLAALPPELATLPRSLIRCTATKKNLLNQISFVRNRFPELPGTRQVVKSS